MSGAPGPPKNVGPKTSSKFGSLKDLQSAETCGNADQETLQPAAHLVQTTGREPESCEAGPSGSNPQRPSQPASTSTRGNPLLPSSLRNPERQHDTAGGAGCSSSGQGLASTSGVSNPQHPATQQGGPQGASAEDAQAAPAHEDDDVIEHMDISSSDDDEEAEAEEGERGNEGEEGLMRDELGVRLVIEKILGVANGQPGMCVVKFEGKSYRDCELATLSEGFLNREIHTRFKAFLQRKSSGLGEVVIDPDWCVVERIIRRRRVPSKATEAAPANLTSVVQYHVKWKGLEYGSSTWFLKRNMTAVDKVAVSKWRRHQRPITSQRTEHHPDLESATYRLPKFASGRKLRPYQEEAVYWMTQNYTQHRNCILGDEMGLGKTISTIAALRCIKEVGKMHGLVLVVAPLTTIDHWMRAFEDWSDLNVVNYHGEHADRKVIVDCELFQPRASRKDPLVSKVDVVITTYERLVADKSLFEKMNFEVGVFDEAHKLKGLKLQVRGVVVRLEIRWKLLLTGTPIQNRMLELFSIMNILNPKAYSTANEFLNRFGGGTHAPTAAQVHSLQGDLKPVLCRRVKYDVENIPAMEEIILSVELTKQQRICYKAMYAGTICTILAGKGYQQCPQLRNLAMELRKLCGHPYLCNGLEDFIRNQAAKAQPVCDAHRNDPAWNLELLTRGSGKLVFLSKFLPMLKKDGSRVLIFSQHTRMLDILGTFLDMLGYHYERIDGSVKGKLRQHAIDRFQDENNPNAFVFLLSTRAGGMGITLTAADTCIIYDFDWNPMGDLQAMGRSHRIGQKKNVKSYRLLTKDTIEEHMFATSSKKLGMSEAILGCVPSSSAPAGDGASTSTSTVEDAAGTSADLEPSAAEIENLLKYGAHNIAALENFENGEKFEAEDIVKTLACRTTKRSVGASKHNAFSIARFATSEEGPGGPVRENAAGKKWAGVDRDFWEGVADLMPEAVEDHKAKEAAKKAEENKILERSERKGRDNSNSELASQEFKDKVTKRRIKDARQRENKRIALGGLPASGAGTSTAPIDPSQIADRWTVPEVEQFEKLLMSFGPGRASHVLAVINDRAARPGTPFQSKEKPLNKTLEQIIVMSEILFTLTSAAEQICRAHPAPEPVGASGSGTTRAAAAPDEAGAKDLDVEMEAGEGSGVGSEGEEAVSGKQGGGAVSTGTKPNPSAASQRGTEIDRLLVFMQPLLKDLPAETITAIRSLETQRRIMKKGTQHQSALWRLQRVVDLLLHHFDPSAAAADVRHTAPAGEASFGPAAAVMAAFAASAAGAGYPLKRNVIPEQLKLLPTFSKILTQLPGWWVNSHDHQLLHGVVMEGFNPRKALEWVMGRLADPSKEGFYNVAISMEGLLKEQKTRQKRLAGCGKSGADAPSKAAAESQAAVHVSRVAEEVSGAAAAAAAEPGLKWYATSSGRMVALQPKSWTKLQREMAKRVLSLLSNMTS